jgi:glycosyltransferase involved in cell wall biosynthesis
MKIAIVSDAIYPYNKGGKEKLLYELSTRLVRNGHEVHLYCMKWWSAKNLDKLESGVHLHAISSLHPLYSGLRRSIKEALFFSFASFKLMLQNFDVLVVDSMPQLVLFPLKIISLLKRRKMLVIWHEVWGLFYWQSYLGPKLGVIASMIEKWSAQLPNTIISVSPKTTSRLIQILGRQKNVVTLSLGVDINTINQVSASSKTQTLIYAGRLLSHKHLDVLIQSVKLLTPQYPHLNCLIIGEGPESRSLNRLVNRLKLAQNIHFLPFFHDSSELYSRIKASQIFISPSTREGFGLAVLEANACGIPAIVVDCADNAAKDLILPSVNGLICALSVSALASSITTLIIHPLDPHQVKQSVQKYDWDILVDKFQNAALAMNEVSTMPFTGLISANQNYSSRRFHV